MQSQGFYIGVYQGDTVTLPVNVVAQGFPIDLSGFIARLTIHVQDRDLCFNGMVSADGKRIVIHLTKSNTADMPVGNYSAWLIVESGEFRSSHPGQVVVSAGSDSEDYGIENGRSVIERFPGRISAEQSTITVYSMLFWQQNQ